MATYAIGDVQGCYTSLMKLLDLVSFADDDQLWLAGDLVNRGPDSVAALKFVKGLGAQAKTVLGNHDLHLLAIHSGLGTRKAGKTLQPVLNDPECDELMSWLIQQPLLVDDPSLSCVMTHAGIPHIWSLEQVKQLANEVETALKTDPDAYFSAMYGNKPSTWKTGLTGTDRLRVITNYLTRMRFITEKGKLDFDANEGLDSQPKGYRPWFAHKRDTPLGRRIICGHWAALGFYENSAVTCLDTGCVWGNRLTALRLEDGAQFSVRSAETDR